MSLAVVLCGRRSSPGQAARRSQPVSPFVRLGRAGACLLSTLVFLLITHAGALAQTSPRPLVNDGAWCWFGNPRAVFKDGQVYFGYVRYADGRVGLNTFDPQSGISSNLWLSVMAQKDDHDNPALLELADGRMLALYARHGSEKVLYYRVSGDSQTALAANWGPELSFTNTTANVTYANPYQLAAETNRIYNFMRNLNFNPTFITSDSSATNWSAPQILIRTGTGGTRPYVQYCSDFDRRIDVLYTDGHPSDMGYNSLYHIYYRDGALYKTDGTFLKYLTNAPLLHDSGERGSVIYAYSTAPSSDPGDHIQNGRAWSWDIACQSNGAPVVAFTVQVTNVMGSTWTGDRIYYYYARWTGSGWQKRFIAHAGRPLYDTQRDYAGGISLDDRNPNVVYISSNAADPFNLADLTNVPLRAASRYEIFRGVTTDGGLTFSWEAVTTNSIVDNLRPYCPRRNPYPVGVLWYAGTYTSYTAWNTAVYGIFATNLVPVTVAPNAPPVASLLSPSVTPLVLTNLSNRLQLRASVTDDGQPGPLTTLWTTVSGPASASFADPDQPATSVGFPQPGLYVLRLQANDTAASASATLSVLAGSGGVPPADSALWLRLNESSGTAAADNSGNGNNGALCGNGIWNPAGGPRDGAIELNGTNSFISVADAPALDNTSALTLAFWFRAYSYTSGGAGLVSKRNAISDNNAYTTYLQTDRLIYVDLDGNNNRFSSTTVFDTNTWYHVAVTFDGSLATNQRARLYVNGALDKVAAEASPAIPNYNSTVKVGLTHSNATTYLNGAMADVRFYRRALSDLEVASLAAVKVAPSVSTGPAPAATNAVAASLAGAAAGDPADGPLAVQWTAVSGPGQADFTAPGQPQTSVTFLAAGDYVLRLSASNAVAEVFADLPVTASPNQEVYADWIAAAFVGATNVAVIGPKADPDGDGADNLLEFALGMNPALADANPWRPGVAGLPVAALQTLDGTNYLTMSYRRPAGRVGLVYQVQVSADLAAWSGAVLVSSTAESDGSEVLVYRDTIPSAAAERRFIRLRVDL